MKKYLRHKTSNIITIGEINALEYRNYKGKFSNDVDVHDFWEICYLEKGSAICLANKTEQLLNEGSIFYIEPNTPHSFLKQDPSAKVLCIGFECLSTYIKPLCNRVLTATEKQKSILNNLTEESSAYFFMNSEEQLVRKEDTPLGCMQIINILLEHLILLSLRQITGSSSTPLFFLSGNDFYHALTEKLKQFCQEHVKEKIRLDDVCKDIGYSKSFVCKLFKEQTGQSVFQYFNTLKTEEAKKLLIGTNMTATQISDNLQFSDPKYFNTLFKAQVGLTPVQFKKLHGK